MPVEGLRVDRRRLKVARHQRALTQQELAEAANVHPVTLARIESGTQLARASTIRQLALALNVPVLEIAEVLEEIA